ncbi:hypothetical protein SOV92_16140 [Pectobacterium brasiliense]|uniref:Uncharacterized protein n=1 Tax=Pectobacterium brasiliense TaxID=180957 RepID=A0AAW9HDH9_9GAMM|nr:MULTISPECIES: hypothetical protein [Pectobacterium]MCE9730783.1 hypothetical protein [Pectobacterium sp. IFB5596]MDY4379333.1 hypothetical protein [Pectobacterium brasiliense]
MINRKVFFIFLFMLPTINVSYATTPSHMLNDARFEKVSDKKTRPVRDVLNDLVDKHNGDISRVGFSNKQLDSEIYVRSHPAVNFSKYSTLREYLAMMFELKNLKSISKIDEKGEIGIRIKISGQPYAGFSFYSEDGEFYLKGIVVGNDIIRSKNNIDDTRVYELFYSYAIYVLDANGAKL